jgi:hypothetical protein
MALKKSELYSSLRSGSDELRGGMDESQHKDYVLSLLYKMSQRQVRGRTCAPITIPRYADLKAMVALKGKSDIGEPPRAVQFQRQAASPLGIGHLEQIDLRHRAGNIE